MTGQYGTAVLRRRDDGHIEIVQADDTVGLTFELLAAADFKKWVDADGLLWLAGDPAYRYRPVRFDCPIRGLAAGFAAEGSAVLVCERVR